MALRKFLIAVSSCVALCQGSAFASDGKIGILAGYPAVGADLEYGQTVGLGGRFFHLPNYTYRYALWGQCALPLSKDGLVGVMAGAYQDWTVGRNPAMEGVPPTYYQSPLGCMLGAYYRHQWGPWWVKATPNLCLRITGIIQYYDPAQSFLDGPPWLEVGYQITPDIEASLRLALSFLKVAWQF